MSRVFRVAAGGSVWIPAFHTQVIEDEPLDMDTQAFEASWAELREQARREAAAIKRKAHEEAGLILKKARQEAAEYRKQAEREGFDTGYKAGLSKGLDEAQKLVDQAKQALAASREAYGKYIRDAEPKLLALALEVAKKVVGEALHHDPERIMSMLRQGIEAMGDERRFQLLVNPRLVAFVEGTKQGLEREFGVEITEVIGDPSIAAGAVLETPSGQIDVTVDTQIENLAKAIGEARNCVGEQLS